jgi:deoxyribodipyrimidine photo-lyase
MEYTIFIFRRDLRLTDNKGLIYAMKNYKNILPIFVFTPEQVTDKNKYKSDNAIQFMIESLQELNQELKKHNSKLHLFYGDNITVLKSIINKIKVVNIIFNKDYTPYAINRDKKIAELCNQKNINCISTHDYLLKEIGSMNKKDGSPYSIFTPFKNNGLKQTIEKVDLTKPNNLVKSSSLKESGWIKYEINKNILVNGGRTNGLKLMKQLNDQKQYQKTHNTLIIPTSYLSSYIKFGCLSIREVYWKFKDLFGLKHGLMAQLFWREFYYYIAFYFPEVLKGKTFQDKYNKLTWDQNITYFKAWCNGKTGYPIIDAGMRELNTTGFMHNRARLFTSNFLNRILNLDWHKGEQYFAQKLTDYDPSVNNGNWGWITSTGVDPKPYFQRLFNPWLQSYKFDPDCQYIKKWIPELSNVENKHLHNWDEYSHLYKDLDYPDPIVDYKKAREKSIIVYRKIK